MCGLFGVFYRNRSLLPDRRRLETSAAALAHRGPDHTGLMVREGLGLVHTRLSLIDLDSRAHQPYIGDSDRYVLVYNGEIYNHAELRQNLESIGCSFRTTSDTEVLFQALIQYGPDETLLQVEGMFAFAFADLQEETLLLARDRHGTKPLVYAYNQSEFLFSSEFDALRSWWPMASDNFTVSAYISGFIGPTQDVSFFDGVRFVEAGEYLVVKSDLSVARTRWHSMEESFGADQERRLKEKSELQLVDELDELLNQSVAEQLLADAPVGCLCSGGVDSSIICAIAARHHSDLAIFHANVVGKFSEKEAAERLAKHLGLPLQVTDVDDEAVMLALPEVTKKQGMPLLRPEAIPLYLVSKLVRESGTKAILCGEGSDECFLGYSWIPPNLLNSDTYLDLLRALKHRIVGTGSRWSLYPSAKDFSLGLLSGFEIPCEQEREMLGLIARAGSAAARKNFLTIDLLSYHLRTELLTGDCMGMAASVESRFPFLSHDVVKFAVNLAYRYKIRFSPGHRHDQHPFFIDKWIVRKVGERYLPPVLSGRKKEPFRVPSVSAIKMRDAFFHDSALSNHLRLARTDVDHLCRNAPPGKKSALIRLDAWIHTCLLDRSVSEYQEKLLEHHVPTS